MNIFDNNDNLTIDTTNDLNTIVYVSTNYLNTLNSEDNIGVSNMNIVNWTNIPDIKDSVVICLFVQGAVQEEVGVFSPFLAKHNTLDNAFILNFPKFNLDLTQANKLIFDANPSIWYNSKKLKLFASTDEVGGKFTIDTSSVLNAVVSVETSLFENLINGSEIGLNNIIIENWTDTPNLANRIILYCSIPNSGGIQPVGVLSSYILKHYTDDSITDSITNTKNWIITNKNLVNTLNNVFVYNFPYFTIDTSIKNKLVFSANPSIWYNSKKLKLFAASDAVDGEYILDMTSSLILNGIAYIAKSYLDTLATGSEIGLSHITITNWTETPNLTDKVVLCMFIYNNAISHQYVGLLAPYLLGTEIAALSGEVNDIYSKIDKAYSQYSLNYSKSLEIIKPFLAKYRAKNSDVTIIVNGDSISEHPQTYGTSIDYKTLPPLMARYNYTSLLFKEFAWDGQEYRRADGTSEDTGYVFTETGEWNTVNTEATMLSDWDDSDDTTGTGWRGGFTRYSNMNGANSVSFEVPEDAWAFNFIYRADIHGGLMNVVITGGNNKLQVFDGTNWIEANGYQFNTLQTADYANGVGNTMYQARLKFRSFDKDGTLDTRGTAKTVTISKAENDSRLCYWGVEWSPAEFMFTIISSSRGSQTLIEMQQTIKTELYDRNADLFIFQVPLINMGTIPSLNSVTPENHLSAVTSFISDVKSDANSWSKYQCVMILPNIYSYANCWYDGTNEYKLVYNQIAKKMLSTRDYYDIFSENFFDSNEIGFVNTFNAFMAEILNYFPTYAQGLAASSLTGDTFTTDGTHPNHRGSDTFFKYIKPLFFN